MHTISDATAVILTLVIFALAMGLVFLYSAYRHLKTNNRVLKAEREQLQGQYDQLFKKK